MFAADQLQLCVSSVAKPGAGLGWRVTKMDGSMREAREELQEWLLFLRTTSHVITAYPHLLFEHAANQPDDRAPARAAHHRFASGRECRPWFRWVNKPQHVVDVLTLTGHRQEIRGCAFAPDGRTIVSASHDRTLKIWDALIGRELATLSGHTDTVRACAYSPDGRWIASASDDHTVRIWDAATLSERATLGDHGYSVLSCRFSADSTRLLSASAAGSLLWAVSDSGEATILARYPLSSKCAALSPDGSSVVLAHGSQLVVLDAASGERTANMEGHLPLKPINDCTFSPDGRQVLSASSDHTLRLWDPRSGKSLAVLQGHRYPVVCCRFSPDGSRIISAAGDLKLWDASTGEELATLSISEAQTCAFSPDGSQIVEGSGIFREGVLRVWPVSVFTEPEAEGEDVRGGWACEYSPDGSRIVAACEDNALAVFDASTQRPLRVLRGHEKKVNACRFTPDGTKILSVSDDTTVMLWNADTGRRLAVLSQQPRFGMPTPAFHMYEVADCAVSPDGTLAVSASADRSLLLWDLADRNEMPFLAGHHGSVEACAISPDGTSILSASMDKKLKLWDVSSHREIATLSGHNEGVSACAFSPDGSMAVSGSADGRLILWDVQSLKALATLDGHRSRIAFCRFSPDGRWLISTASRGTTRLWEVATGKPVYEGIGWDPTGWSPNGEYVAAAGGPTILRPENLPLAAPIVTAWRKTFLKGPFWSRKQATRLGAGCPHCHAWFEIDAASLDTELACPCCGRRVRLNKFMVNGDWELVAKAWRKIEVGS